MTFDVEHIAVVAINPPALKKWYERVLGAREIFNIGQTPPTCLIGLGNVWLEIYAAEKSLPETANNKLAGIRHIALRVPSIADARCHLEKQGVTFFEEMRPAAGGGQVLFF